MFSLISLLSSDSIFKFGSGSAFHLLLAFNLRLASTEGTFGDLSCVIGVLAGGGTKEGEARGRRGSGGDVEGDCKKDARAVI
jgi:hypothetical protein